MAAHARALWFSRRIGRDEWRVYLADRSRDADLWQGDTACDGRCCYADRAIVIAADAPRAEWPGTLLHEIAHARCRDLSELTVRAVERRLVGALLPHWRPPPLSPDAERLARRVRARQRREAKREDRE